MMRKHVVWTALLMGAGLAAAFGLLWSGVYNIGADDPHWRPTHAFLQLLRDRSIDSRVQTLVVPPDLGSPDRIRRGAGNYAAMCAGCHLVPEEAASPLSLGLYPSPPMLAGRTVPPARAFWVIKHGIKASGMAAWGKHMGDADIWDLVAMLQQLPKLDRPSYNALVASSGGHVHAGEEGSNHHDHDDHDDHDQKEPTHRHDHVDPPGTPPDLP